MNYIEQIVQLQTSIDKEVLELRKQIDIGNPFIDNFRKVTEKYNKLIDVSQLLNKAEELIEEVQFD